MKALERTLLTVILPIIGALIITGITTGCQQQTAEPRIDTSNQQMFYESLNQVRSRVDEECIEQFDQAVDHAQRTYHLQIEYSLLPASNPLNGLSAEEVLKLTPENHRHAPRRFRNWTSI